MRYCTNCGKQLEENALFCAECGQKAANEQPKAAYTGPVDYVSPQYTDPADEKPLSTGQWFLTTFLLALPIAGFIIALVWAFGDGGNKSRKNFCRAHLIWMLVALVIVIILFIVMIPITLQYSHTYII